MNSFLKLLVIPLLLVQFRRSEHGNWVFAGYLLSCVALLVVTTIVIAVPPLAATFLQVDNVIVKNAATQSGEFVICIFGLLYLMVGTSEQKRWQWALACVAVILAMLANIFYFSTGRTALVTIFVLFVLLALKIRDVKDDCRSARRGDRSRHHCLDVVAVLARAHERSRPKRRNTKRQTKERQRANGWNSGKSRSNSFGRRR